MPAATLEPEVEVKLAEEKTTKRTEPEPAPRKSKVRSLFREIFEGHEEYLGYTPD